MGWGDCLLGIGRLKEDEVTFPLPGVGTFKKTSYPGVTNSNVPTQ